MVAVRFFVALAVVWLLGAAGPAIARDSSEIQSWNKVRQSRNPDDLKTFLNTYPTGLFAPLARRRLEEIGDRAPDPSLATASTKPSIRPVNPRVRGIEPVLARVDARALGAAARSIAIAVPGDMPEDLPVDRLKRDGQIVSQPISMLALPPAFEGPGELRLYAAADTSDDFHLVAKAPLEIEPPPGGATSFAVFARDLSPTDPPPASDAPAAPVRLAAHALRAFEDHGEVAADLLVLPRVPLPQTFTLLLLGHLDMLGRPLSATLAGCLLDPPTAALARAARRGDEVIVEGTTDGWSDVDGANVVLLNPCRVISVTAR